ncbi:MAG: hypothetical protein J6I58_08970 [Eubacterium sp.]|nr:hypothetical protein [Eubacterium sp.]
MDVGKYVHSIRSSGYLDAVNHINIQIVTKAENIRLDVHLILDAAGNVIDKVVTGPWAKNCPFD